MQEGTDQWETARQDLTDTIRYREMLTENEKQLANVRSGLELKLKNRKAALDEADTAEQRLGRELMTPSELATMPGDRCILQLRGLPPFFSPKYDLKRHPNYRYTAEADKQKNAFDLDRLINRRRRPGLNEACTMYEVAVPDDALTEEDEDILNYDDIDDPDAFA